MIPIKNVLPFHVPILHSQQLHLGFQYLFVSELCPQTHPPERTICSDTFMLPDTPKLRSNVYFSKQGSPSCAPCIFPLQPSQQSPPFTLFSFIMYQSLYFRPLCICSYCIPAWNTFFHCSLFPPEES